MAAAVPVADVRSLCHLADYIQVHTPVGVDHGLPGGDAQIFCTAYLGERVLGLCQFHQGIHGPAVRPDHDQYHRHQYSGHLTGNRFRHPVRADDERNPVHEIQEGDPDRVIPAPLCVMGHHRQYREDAV